MYVYHEELLIFNSMFKVTKVVGIILGLYQGKMKPKAKCDIRSNNS